MQYTQIQFDEQQQQLYPQQLQLVQQQQLPAQLQDQQQLQQQLLHQQQLELQRQHQQQQWQPRLRDIAVAEATHDRLSLIKHVGDKAILFR